jgi:hypothetical protein
VELDDSFSRIISSEVINNIDYDIDLIAGLPDNGRGAFFSRELNKFLYIHRRPETGKNGHAFIN